MKMFTVELSCRSIACAVALLVGSAATSQAQTLSLYNSIPNPVPPNVASEGPEAYAFSELGDGFSLGPAGRTLFDVSVVLASWACVSGNWYSANCVTPPGSTYTLPITVNIYSVVSGSSLEGATPAPAPGALLATMTKSFSLPYRPSTNATNCNGGAWYDTATQTCYDGLAAEITFDLQPLHVILPSQVIVGFSYNTTHYGPHPIGEGAACFSTTQGCFYDSLNISTDTNNGYFQAIGQVLNVNGIFVDYTLANNACVNSATTAIFGLDASPGCWTGYHPEIQLTAR
jgi:hypothetical protein